MELTTDELAFLHQVLAQINPQGLDANVTRIGVWAKVEAELEARQEEEEHESDE